MAWARSANTAANWVATVPSGVEPAASCARAAWTPVCCTALSSVACSPWRVCVGRSLRTLRTVTDVAFDWSAATVPCAASARSELAS